MIGRLVVVAAGATAGAIATWKLALEPWYREWGVDPAVAPRALPGDDVIAEPTVVDTRVIEIAASPEGVWPWLVQMGFGKAGWYSYDMVDMIGQSVDEIRPEWQSLSVGDIVPFQPSGGFVVKSIEPGRSLVLYMDSKLITEQIEAAEAKAAERGESPEATPANLRAAGAAMSPAMPPDFEVSWAFVLEPIEGGKTRLIERLRVRLGEGQPMSKVAGPFMGFGVFLMTRKQMLGIRQRAEAAALGRPITIEVESGSAVAPSAADAEAAPEVAPA
jgi:hypothetical protein